MRKNATPQIPQHIAAVNAHVLEKFLVKRINTQIAKVEKSAHESLQYQGAIGGQLTAYHTVLDFLRTHVIIDTESGLSWDDTNPK